VTFKSRVYYIKTLGGVLISNAFLATIKCELRVKIKKPPVETGGLAINISKTSL
jgi:hypothetical protein